MPVICVALSIVCEAKLTGEPLALKDFLARTSLEDDGLYSLSDLWDYLDVNWGSSIAVSSDSHHFANVKDALSRLESFEDVKSDYADVLKSISIIELSSQMTGINASNQALQIALDCTSNMPNSELRSVYNMSVNEAEILKKHPKVL